jgi:FixJ family two-component response regulator
MRVLLCTGFPTDDRIADLAGTGAHGFVEKTNTWDEFLHAVEQVSHGEYYFCSHNAGIAPEAGRLQKTEPTSLAQHLTAREKEIITLVAHGFTSKEIAAKLGISLPTVEPARELHWFRDSLNRDSLRGRHGDQDWQARFGRFTRFAALRRGRRFTDYDSRFG